MKPKFLLSAIAVVVLVSGFVLSQQNKKKMSNTETSKANPLLCDPQKGVCEVPAAGAAESSKGTLAVEKPVKVIYFTDPICSSCWGIEPQLRRMKLEYHDCVEVEYHMGGLLPKWEGFNGGGISKPSDVSHHWDEVSAYYDMPIDGDVWLEDPLPSSYPPSVAFKAAQLQDKDKAVAYLRRIREMVFLEKKNITKWEYMQLAAEQCGLDVERFKKDYDGPAQQLFRDDLQLAAKMGVRGFPTLFFTNASGVNSLVYGFRPYDQFESSIMQLYPQAVKSPMPPSLEKLFAVYPTLTAREVAVIQGVSRQDAVNALMRMVSEKRAQEKRYKNGSMWMATH